MTTVLIEDYALLRVALEHVLARVQGVGEIIVLSAAQLSDLPMALGRVDLLVMDAHPDVSKALETLARALAAIGPGAVLTLFETEDPTAMAAFARQGVRGYLPRSSNPVALAAAVSLVLAGGECYPRVDSVPLDPPRPRLAAKGLTQRQEQILNLLAQGHSMREIAERIGISAATVKSHARTLYWKLNVRNQAEAAFIARRRGLVRPVGDPSDDRS